MIKISVNKLTLMVKRYNTQKSSWYVMN